jgi:hypothetical protein
MKKMHLSSKIILALLLINLISSFAVLVPLPLFPVIPKAQAQYEGVTFDAVNNIATFNQNSSYLFYEWYQADISNNLTLLSSTGKHRFQNFDSPTFIDQTTGSNNATANDMKLIPNPEPDAVTDLCYWGSEDRKFNMITLNVTTAGVYTSTLIWQYFTTSWQTLTVTQSPNPVFKTAGVGTILFNPPSAWAKTTINSINAYWVRAKVSVIGVVTTQPKGGQSWISYRYDSDVRPAELLGLRLDFIVSSFTSAGTIDITGYDIDSNVVSETFQVTADGNYTTANKFSSLSYDTSYNVKATGSFTFYLQQRRWGSIATSLFGSGYTMLSALRIGNGSSVISVSDTLQQLYISYFTSTQSYAIEVSNNATLTFGTLVNENNKVGKDGLQIFSQTFKILYCDSGANVYIYSSSIKYSDYNGEILSHGTTRIWGMEGNIIFKGTGFDVNNYINIASVCIADAISEEFSGSFNRITSIGQTFVLFLSKFISNDITINNIYVRNCSSGFLIHYALGTYPAYNVYLIDADSDNWVMQISSMLGKVYRQYTFDLTMTGQSNIPLQYVNVTLKYHGQGGGIVGSWLTDASGEIPQQIVTAGYYDSIGGSTINDYNPYEIIAMKNGYVTYDRNFTQLERKSWNIALIPNIAPTAVVKPFPIEAKVNSTVTLDGTTSGFPIGETLSDFRWDFGDGNITSGYYPLINHVWTTTGTFQINLTVTSSPSNLTGTIIAPIIITDYFPPNAGFIVSPTMVYLNESVFFDASGSYDMDGIITDYSWDFGDGSPIGNGTGYDIYTSIINYTSSGAFVFILEGTSYLDTWNTDYPAYMYPETDFLSFGQLKGGVNYEIYRSGLFFLTISIPSNATIFSASINMRGYRIGTPTLVVQTGQPLYPHNPMIDNDCWRELYTGNGGSIASWIDYVYNKLDLNDEGLLLINKGGLTKLMLRTSDDINGIAPLISYPQYIQIYSVDETPPYLNVTYSVPRLIPTISHTYTSTGNKTVTLTLTDNHGKTSEISTVVTVTEISTGGSFGGGFAISLILGIFVIIPSIIGAVILSKRM